MSRKESASSCECLLTHCSTFRLEISSPKMKELTLETVELDHFDDKNASLKINLDLLIDA